MIREERGEEYDKWDDHVVKDLEVRLNKLRGFDETLNESTNEDTIEITEQAKNVLKCDTVELVANQIYDKLTIYFKNDRKRFDIKKGEPIIDLIREYLNFELSDDGEITYKYKRTVTDLGNIDEGLKAPWEIRKLGVKRLRLMGFRGITDKDVKPSKTKYKVAREKVRKLDENLDKGSKAIESSSTTNAEAIEMIEVTSKNIDTTVKEVEKDTSFIEPSERDNLLPLRELEGLDKQLRTIKGSLKVAIAKCADLKSRTEYEERKLSKYKIQNTQMIR